MACGILLQKQPLSARKISVFRSRETLRAHFPTTSARIRKPGKASVLQKIGVDDTCSCIYYTNMSRSQSSLHPAPADSASDSPVSTLYRPVGPEELALIAASGYREFPPRLPEQPIFYPVLHEEYARQIARDWNVKASGAGYVTRFQVATSFLARYPERVVGSALHRELWIPEEDLAALNRNIIGLIEIIAEFLPDAPAAALPQ
jgi:hypothetical protein